MVFILAVGGLPKVMPVLMLFLQKALQYPSSILVSTDWYNCDGATSITNTAVAAM